MKRRSAESPVEKCQSCSWTVRRFIVMCEDPQRIKKFLLSHDCIPQAVLCDRCKAPLRLDWDKREFRCQRSYVDGTTGQRRKCNFYQSCLKGTFFENGKLPFDKVLILLAYWLAVPPPRQAFLCSDLEISSKTAVEWQTRGRNATEDWMEAMSLEQIGGEGETVEIDEAKVGKRLNNKGRRVEGQWVFGGILRSDPKKMFVVPVEDRTKETLLAIIQERILPGTTLVSDCWSSYDCLKDEGYVHLTVNHSIHFRDPFTNTHTQNIERMWRDVRAQVPRYGRKKESWNGYLSEFAFKRAFSLRERLHGLCDFLGEEFAPENRCAPPLPDADPP